MDDLISRQAAIDAIYACHVHGKNLKRFCEKLGHTDAFSAGILDAVNAIEDLLPVALPIKDKCQICPHCDHCDVNEDGLIQQNAIPIEWIKDWFADELDIKEFEEFLEPPYDPSVYVQSILEQMFKDWSEEDE